ncbi:SLC8B1 family protein [Megaselia abdita]
MRNTLERQTIDIHEKMTYVIDIRRSLYPLDRDLEVIYSKKDSDEDLGTEEIVADAVALMKDHERQQLNDTKRDHEYSEILDEIKKIIDVIVFNIQSKSNIKEYLENIPHETKKPLETIHTKPIPDIFKDFTDEETESFYDSLPENSSFDFKSCEDNLDIGVKQTDSQLEIFASIVTLAPDETETNFTEMESTTEDSPLPRITQTNFSMQQDSSNKKDPSFYKEDEHLRQRTSKKRSRSRFSTIVIAVDYLYESRQGLITLWMQFLNSLVQVDWEDFKVTNWVCKIFTIITIPINIILALVIPKADLEAPMNGWSKMLNCIHFITLPTVFIWLIDALNNLKVFGIPFMIFCLPWFIAIAFLVYFTSKVYEPPMYHKVFFAMALTGAMIVICYAVQNVMAILDVISYVTQLSVPFLESTFGAIGYSTGYIVSNVQFAREGYAKMAFAACFGGPMNLLSIGFGSFLAVRCLEEQKTGYGRIESTAGSLGRNCFVFMACGLFGLILAMIVTNFVGRKSIGAFLIIIYIFGFITFCLSEFDVIHPFGTDHSLDID